MTKVLRAGAKVVRAVTGAARAAEAAGEKFGAKPEIAEANVMALKAGYNFADTTEIFTVHYHVGRARIKPGKYRNITGNLAISVICGITTFIVLKPGWVAGGPLYMRNA